MFSARGAYGWYGQHFIITPDADKLESNKKNICVGLQITPHGGILQCDDAMARLRALGTMHKNATMKIIKLQNTPPDWMSAWLAKAW
jgi:hypothetical protein